MSDAANTILTLLDGMRIKLRHLHMALGAALFFAAWGGAFLLITPLVKWGGLQGMWGVVAATVKFAALAAIVYSLVRYVIIGFFYGLNRHDAALQIERTIPGLMNDLVISLELLDMGSTHKMPLLEGKLGDRNMFSPALAAAHIDAAAVRLSALDYTPALPYRPMQRASASAAALLVLSVIMAAFWPIPSSQAAAYLMSTRFLQGRAMLLKMEQPLSLGEFEIRYEYPAYTGWEPKESNGADGSLRAIKGSVATIRTRSLHSLKSARFQMDNSAVPATLRDRAIEARIDLMQPGRYRIMAEGAGGEHFAESAAHTIEILPDTPPQIEIISPAVDQEFEEAGVLSLKFASTDDFGIKQIDVVYSTGGKELHVPVVTPESGRREIGGTYTWDLSKLNLQPGDEVRYYLEAQDNDAVSGPKKGASRTWRLSIFSPNKEHSRLVDMEWQLFDAMIATLGNTLVRKPLVDGRVTPEALRPDRIIADGLDDLVNRLDEIIAGLEKDRLADLNTFNLLKNIRSDFKGLLKKRQAVMGDAHPPENSLARRQAAETPVMENAVLALDNELERQKVTDVMQKGDDLLATQRKISDLLKKAKAGDKEAMAKLEKELAHMQELMRSMMESLSRSKGNMPDEFINADALKQMPAMESADQFAKIREALQAGKMDDAIKMAEELQDSLAKMMAAMESGAESFGDSRMGEAMKKVEEISKRATDLKERQQKLFDESQKIGVHAQEELLKRQEQERKGVLEQLRKKMKELRDVSAQTMENSKKLEPDKKHSKDANFRNYIMSLTNGIFNLLNYQITQAEALMAASDFYSMLGVMQSALLQAQQSQRDSQAILSLDITNVKQTREVVRGADRMVTLTVEIIELLQKLLKPVERNLSREEMKRMQEMAEEQEKLKNDAEALQSQMEELRKETPVLEEEQSKKVGEAAGAMGQAGNRLGSRDPNGALPHESQALQKLSEVEDALKGLQERMKKGAKGMPIPMPGLQGGSGQRPGGGSSGGMGEENGYQKPGRFVPGKVEIPGREDYKVPGQYREDILRAMRHNSPEQYRQLNRDYYKKLVE